MKILRIHLQNLNSLRGDHEIDFQKEPLLGAGLFAITGQTGAGKSTLLDAITLALYGRAARYGNVSNPEDMMSRHTGECRAEVEFEVARGRFRAVWHLRRGRGKADGNVQPPKRYIYDASGQEQAHSIREAEELIEKLIGLDYQRFMRSVLLAQGEFARFLKASADERAQLLESLTGTEIYSELSELAHREAARRESEVNALAASLGQVTLLTEAERREREELIQQKNRQLAEIKAALEKLNQQLNQARRLQSELSDEKALLAQEQDLLKRKADAQPDLDRLTSHRKTAPFADDLTRLDVAQKHCRDLETAVQAAGTQSERTHHVWITSIVAGCEFVKDLVARQKQQLTAAEEKVQAQQKRKQDAAQWLEEHAEDKPLEQDFPELYNELDRLKSLRDGVKEGKARSQGLATKIEAQHKMLTECATHHTRAEALLKAKAEEQAAAEAALQKLIAGKTEQAREEELSALRERSNAFVALLEKETACQAKREQLQQHQADLETRKPRLKEGEDALADARTRSQEADRQVLLLRDHLHKSELIASLQEHRAHLKAGDPCPLCGATEHPFLDGLKPVVSEDSLRNDLKKAELNQGKAAAELRQKELLLQGEKRDVEHLEKGIHQVKADLKRFSSEIQALLATHQISAQSLEALREAQAANQAAIQKAAQELAAITSQRSLLANHEAARLKAEGALQVARQRQENEQKGLAALQEQLRDHLTNLQQKELELQRASQLLKEVLHAYKVDLPTVDQESNLAKTLKDRLTAYQGWQKALLDASSSLERASVEVQKHSAASAELDRKASPFFQSLCEHEADAHAADPLLGQKTRTLWRTIEDAEAAVLKLFKERDAAQNALTHQQNELKKAAEHFKDLAATLLQSLQGSPFATIEALRAARLLNAEADRLENLDRNLHASTEQLKGKLETVRRNIQALRQEHAAEGDAVSELESRARQTQQNNDDIAESIGQLRNELARDEQNRQQHASRTAQLEEQQKRLVVWKQLQGLIGSHDGKKFRRYAQGISLEILVQNGNEHLRRLTDRYRLRRRAAEELELEIEDLYQAGTTRPMASLSGGESFLASLALALGLADLAGRNVQIDSLFIDEGFGTLDATTLDLAISALEALRQDNKTIGVISHVELLKERIATQILVERKPAGTSTLRVVS